MMLDALSWVALLAGAAVTITGGLGLLRLPDVYARTHAASLTDTLGAVLILFGLALQATSWIIVVKLAMIGALLLLTGPVATHALAAAAIHGGLRPRLSSRPATRTPTGFQSAASQRRNPSSQD